MIAAYMGDDKFREGVRLHLSRHMYGNATSDDFFTALSDAGHDPRILAALTSFVEQQGVPLVVISHGEGGKLVATQKRAALLGTNLPATSWTIPLCMKVSGTRSCTLLDKTSMMLDLDASGPIMPNADGVGYYRFALDDADWRTLIAASPTLAAGEALAATDSLWGAFRAGQLAPARLIEAARAMVAHPDSNASVDGGERLAGLRLRGLIPESALADYRLTITSIYGPKLAALGSDLHAGAYASDPSDRQKQRSALVRLVAEEGREQKLRDQLLDAAKRYLAGTPGALDQSELGVGLSVYVDSAGLAGAKGLLLKLVSSQDQLFRSHALDALGSSDRPELARWLLGVLSGPALRQTEKIELLGEIIRQPATRDLAYQYLTSHFDRLSKDAGIFSFGRLMDMPKFYCSAERALEIESTLGARERQYRRGGLELARTVEQVRSCGLLVQSRGADLLAALRAK